MIERNNLVYRKRVIMLVQVQDVVRLVKYVYRGKPGADQGRYSADTNVGYSIDIQAVYLSGQWCHLLEQRNAAARIIGGPGGIILTSIHNSAAIRS